jgi:hypothetical protein
MSLKSDIEDAQKTHDIQSILDTKKRSLVCPLPQHNHTSNTPSFSIFWEKGIQHFKCHGNCNLVCDVIDLVGYLNIPDYNRASKGSVRKALAFIDRKYEVAIPIPIKTEKLSGSEWFDLLPISPEAKEYAASRGLSPETIQKFNLGSKGNYLSMPCFEEGRLIGVKMRRITYGQPRFFNIKGSYQGLFNFDKVAYTTQTVFIVKGEIPCMLLDQLGYLACAPTGGEGGWDEHWRAALAFSHNVVIGDNDAPGRKLGEKRALILGADLVFPPPAYKDIDEALLAEPEEMKYWLDKLTEET